MYNGSTEFNNLIEKPGGNALITRLKFSDFEISKFTKLEYYGGSNNSDDIAIGTTNMAYLDVSAITDKVIMNNEFLLEVGMGLSDGTIEYAPIGYFTVQKPDGDEGTVSFKAYDRMQRFEKFYNSALTYPTDSAKVLNELCEMCGVELATPIANPIIISENLQGYTCREVLGYIAGIHGLFACFDRYGKLDLRWYDETPIKKQISLIWSLTKSQSDYKVEKITIAKNTETTYTSGTGISGINYSNPYATQEIADSIYASLGNFTYRPCEISMLDDIRLDPWDMLKVTYLDGSVLTIPVMALEHSFTSGETRVKSFGKTNTENEYNYSGPVTQAMDRMSAELLVANRVIATKVDAEWVNAHTVTADKLEATNARVETLETNSLTATEADLRYANITLANIDTANIDVANMGLLFTKVGLIDRATIVDGHITGFLDAVEVNANNITAGTLIADRILLKGSKNGLLYALNNLGELTSTRVDTLDGTILTQRTITADKLIANSITANELDVTNIFGDSAVLTTLTSQKAFINAISTNSVVVGANNTANNALNLNNGLGMKINYSGFSTQSNGELYLCAKDVVTGNMSNADGWVWWNNAKRTVAKTMVNPNSICPYNTVIYMVLRLSNSDDTSGITYLVWYNSGWKYATLPTPTEVSGTWTWGANDIVLGSFIEPGSEAAIVEAQLFTPCRTYQQITIGSNAYKNAATANSVLADWCYNNNTTFIDGGKIFTGTVTADKMNVKGLSVTNNNSEKTLEIDNNGNVSLDVKSLKISTKSINDIYTSKEEFNNLEVGGINLQLGSKDWSSNAFYSKGAAIISGGILTAPNNASGANVIETHFIDVKLNEVYTVSFDIKCDAELSDSRTILIEFFNSSDTRTSYSWVDADLTTEWQRITHTFTVKDTSAVKMRMGLRSTLTSPNKNYYRLLKIEKGSKATDWTPAPEDIATSAELSLKVDKETLVTELNASADVITITATNGGGIDISGDKFKLDSKYTKIDTDGTITAKNAYLNGEFTNENIAIGTDGNEYKMRAEIIGGMFKILNETSGAYAYMQGHMLSISNDTGDVDNVYLGRYGLIFNSDKVGSEYKSDGIVFTDKDGNKHAYYSGNGMKTRNYVQFGDSSRPCKTNIYVNNSDKQFSIIGENQGGYAGYDVSITGNAIIKHSLSVYGGIYGDLMGNSDKNIKKDIKELDKDKSANFIYNLIPSEFKFINGDSGRYHHGFIAQEVKETMGDDDWGLFVDKKINNENYEEIFINYETGETTKELTARYLLRYDELIADIVATLQSQNERLKQLEGTI